MVGDNRGNEWRFHGVYHTIEAPLQMIFTYEDEALPGKVSLETTKFEEYEGGTKLITVSVYQSIEDRDNMMESGMQEGGNETMDRLEEVLEKMQAAAVN
jgi:uncharacterized protein YndB with AHSA1/START domain